MKRQMTLSLLLMGLLTVPGFSPEPAPLVPNRPKVSGRFRVMLREQREMQTGNKQFFVVERPVEWEVSETAIIICDMWDDHYCKLSAQRIGVMAPHMNAVLSAARSHGAQIIHAPSDTVYIYAGTPYRQRMEQAKPAKPPAPLENWCNRDPKKEPELPVDTSNCACDDPILGPKVRRYNRQHPGLDIIGCDGVSDNGQEIYNFLKQEGIKNVAIMGVHTNMCVLGRSFGIRQLVKLGFNVALIRDLTDTMYDPREKPHVSHTRGTELVIDHIEKYWCPTVMSDDLTRVVPGSNGLDPNAP